MHFKYNYFLSKQIKCLRYNTVKIKVYCIGKLKLRTTKGEKVIKLCKQFVHIIACCKLRPLASPFFYKENVRNIYNPILGR